MNKEHRLRIDACREDIVPRIDLVCLWPKLLENKVFNRDDVNVPRWTKSLSDAKTVECVYLAIKKRGPLAYCRFITSLRQSGHNSVADILEGKNAGISNHKQNVPLPEVSQIKESDADTFHCKLQVVEKPLIIRVKKAEQFLDLPTDENLQKYPMRSKPRGLVLIITNIEFNNLNHRNSAIHDEKNLTELFEQMGFFVEKHCNLTGEGILTKVNEFSQRSEFRKVDSCFVVIGSHGNMKEEYEKTEINGVDFGNSDYKTVFCSDIMDCFSANVCPNLVGKPKIFLFQVCRGTSEQQAVIGPRYTSDISLMSLSHTDETVNQIMKKKNTIRNHSDILAAYATLSGHAAYRDVYTGSWFIQILCEVFMNHACTFHLQDLLHIVDDRLEKQRTKSEKCQTLTVTCMGFNKHCYLNPGYFGEL